MVKHENQAFKSSTGGLEAYQFEGHIIAGGLLPKTVETAAHQYPTGAAGYMLFGIVGTEFRSAHLWQTPPHFALANLRVEDPRSAEAFIKKYGMLSERGRILDDKGEPTGRFVFHDADLLDMQDTLRGAWKGSPFALNYIEECLEQMPVVLAVRIGGFQLWPKDLWTLICFLFLRDYTAGVLTVCGNPDCPAPYFARKRKTQRFCEQGPCVAYAQRQYSLNWWNREGKKRREKKAKAQHRKSKA